MRVIILFWMLGGVCQLVALDILRLYVLRSLKGDLSVCDQTLVFVNNEWILLLSVGAVVIYSGIIAYVGKWTTFAVCVYATIMVTICISTLIVALRGMLPF